MKMEEIRLGDSVACKVKEDMDAPFTGTVEKKYENSVLLDITDYDQRDKQNVTELNFKIVVNLKAITKNFGGGVEPEPEEADDEEAAE
ncbi:DUF2187 domain-containing protein [Lacticaseibacillus nasuensis]|uniref:DUF2187 domain-containing protein n=1 Tax=Lacticaseibacillus nasuensis TaxID=944671 RepID=UPI002247BABE|nr:DUF2187 domain-containing protein [Lacticaseibacillus nasuensis]MCX2456229.1 YkvS family protein [Lacticaseibacillus nasuensis]